MTTRIIIIILVGIAGLIGAYVVGRRPWHLHLRFNIRVLTIAIALLIMVAAAVITVLPQKVLAEKLAIASYIILILGVIFSIADFIRGGSGEE
jgi:predicted MFS family arabinose efflux permease